MVDAVGVGFALWTLACHGASALGGSLWAALGGFAVLAAATLAWRLSPAGRTRAPAPPDPPAPGGGRRAPLRLAGVALGLGGAALLSGEPVALWGFSVVLLAVAWGVFVLPEVPRGEAPASGPGREWALWALAALCAAVALVSHRVDIDDAFYVNLAAAAADAPGLPVLAGDTLHGIPGLPLHLPVYRLHSYELWNAALSLLTGVPAIACFHLVSAALAAALVPLALARLLRRLSPRHWLAALAATLWVLLVSADTHWWYANFGFVRIWQGKAIFLLVFLPLVYATAIDFARRPSARGFLLLAAMQVAAVGATSSALWVAPVSALAAAACVVPVSWRGLARLGLVLLTSLYVLGAGALVKREMDAAREARAAAVAEEPVPAPAPAHAAAGRDRPGARLDEALGMVLGQGPLRTAAWASLLVTWALLPAGLGRRFAVGVPLAVLLVVLDPFTTRLVAENLVGPSYWRAFWALPIPVLLGLALAAPLGWAGPRRVPGAAGFALALALFAWLPSHGALSEANGVSLHAPGLKVPEDAWSLAKRFAAHAEPGAFVVAPLPVAVWLPTFHDPVHPLVVRQVYLLPYRGQLGERNLRWRVLMTDYVEGRLADATAPRWFREGLDHFDVQAVLLWVTPETVRSRRILERAGFRRVEHDPEWEIWVRS